jgi:hypothetical protein
MEVVDTNVPPPVVPTVPAAAPAAKKVRKPRTPKVKPPKKERVLLGGIVLGWEASEGAFLPLVTQPPADIANDVVKVTRWAAGVEALSKVEGKICMYRKYNATLKVTSTVKLDSSIEFIKEVPQNQQTV